MPILRMETDVIRGVGNQLQQAANLLFEHTQQLSTTVQSLSNNWQGPSANIFISDIHSILQQFNQLSDTGTTLNQRLQREVDEWLQIDGTGAGAIASIFIGIMPRIPQFPWGANDEPNLSDAKREFESQWKEWNLDERKVFFQQQYNVLLAKYGLEPTNLVFEDLPDSFLSDARGQFTGDSIVIDIDNMNSKKGFETFETLIHETRHQIQWEAVKRYTEQGDKAQLPPSVTSKQAKAWSENFSDYVKPKDDFEAYRKQPIEQDARDFAEDYAEKYLEKEYLRANQA